MNAFITNVVKYNKQMHHIQKIKLGSYEQ